jgi:A118 family predicted phage portal protein
MPEANTIDTTSPLGVSGFSRAVSLIKDADMQYSRLLWEYEAGEMAIDIDRDAMKTELGADGLPHERMTHTQERLFRKVDLSTEGDTYHPFAPPLRDASFGEGLNTILMRIEDVCAMSRGTLSDATQEARTATEIKIMKQRSYQANADIQAAMEDCLKEVIYIMNTYCDLYEITKSGEYDVNFEWDDSIIVDIDAEINKRITLMQNGLASKLEVRMWYFGETERQAREALQQIDNENKQSMEEELTMQTSFANRHKEEDDYK